MREHRFPHTALIALLTVALSVTCIPGAFALAQDRAGETGASPAAAASASPGSTASFEKSEVVYANLAANGEPQAVYVVNRFDVVSSGTVVDYGDYESVQNLTDDVDLQSAGDRTAFEVEEGTFAYQGNAAVRMELPWNVAVSYALDGRGVSAEALAGASGELSVHVSSSRNAEADPAFYDSFMLQVTFTLPGDSCSNAVAEGGTIASAGQDVTVAFTALPGHDGDFLLTAHVEDFAMDGAQIVALPYASVMEMPDADGMTSGMEELSDAVSLLAEGTDSLSAGVDELTGGARDLSSGAAAFGDGLATLSGSSAAIVGASARIDAALESIADGLAGADFSQLGQLGRLPAVLRQLADGMDALQKSAGDVRAGYAAALSALESAVAAIPADVTPEEIASLKAKVGAGTDEAATVDKLAAAYRAAQGVKTAFGDGAAFAGAEQMLETLAADAPHGGPLAVQSSTLRALADQLEGSLDAEQLGRLAGLAGGLAQLSGEYGRFHEGLSQYADGLSTLAGNYAQLESGTASLAGGAGRLANGVGQLAGGMNELNASTIDLPDAMREQIEEMMADYDFPEFEPVSFASSSNENVTAVQFVMATAPIEKPEEPVAEEPVAEPTIWERFLALFE